MAAINGTLVEKYQSRFGEQPGTRESDTERERWQQMCQELMDELNRERETSERFRHLAQKILPVGLDLVTFANLTADQAVAMAAKEQSFNAMIEEVLQD